MTSIKNVDYSLGLTRKETPLSGPQLLNYLIVSLYYNRCNSNSKVSKGFKKTDTWPQYRDFYSCFHGDTRTVKTFWQRGLGCIKPLLFRVTITVPSCILCCKNSEIFHCVLIVFYGERKTLMCFFMGAVVKCVNIVASASANSSKKEKDLLKCYLFRCNRKTFKREKKKHF